MVFRDGCTNLLGGASPRPNAVATMPADVDPVNELFDESLQHIDEALRETVHTNPRLSATRRT